MAALAMLDRLDGEVDQQMLGWWLAERQLPNGGLNGRPEKLEDVSDILVWGRVLVLTAHRSAIVTGYSPHWPFSKKCTGLMPMR